MTATSQRSRVTLGALLLAIAIGCAGRTPLMPAPRLYTGEQAKPLFTAVDPTVQESAVDLLFVTDRAPRSDPDEPLPYTSDRSHEMAWGTVRVEIDPGLEGATLAEQSVREKRSPKLHLGLGQTTERGRFPRIPYEVERAGGGVRRASAVMDAHEKAASSLRAEVSRRLASSPRKEFVLFIHGYANTFQDAAFSMGELCHFLGREFVCGIFTWPAAGTRGLMAGYNVDRESGEFAVHHLRQAIRLIATVPELERLHILAHSRGTDVLSSALRELSYEAYMAGTSLPERFKLKNVVLAAPDMDVDVAATKIFGIVSDPDVPFGAAPKPRGVFPPPGLHITVYSSKSDKALGLSSWLFGSVLRLGRADALQMTPEQRARAARIAYLADIVEVEGAPGLIGHSYFIHDPDASADLIALLRYGIPAGAPGRPLESLGRPFWRVRSR
jgi:esterase/lipase superfamily enzyme